MKKVNITVVVLSLVILLLVGYLVVNSEDKNNYKEPIKIGVVTSLTGFLSIYGQTDKAAIDYAVAEINSQGGINGRMIEVIYEDDQGFAKEALTAAQKLINVDGINLILGGTTSSETLAIAPLAQEKNVLLFTSVGSSSELSNYDNVFRNTIISYEQGEKLADLATLQGYQKIALLTENNDYCINFTDGFRNSINSDKIVFDEMFNFGEKDFRSYLTKIKASNPDLIMISPLSGATGGPLVKQIKEYGFETVIYSNEVAGTTDFLETAASSANNIIFYDVPVIEKDSEFEQLLNYFKENNVTCVGDYFAGAKYDFVLILKKALEKCGEDNVCIEEYFKSNEHNGLIGTYSFDENGDMRGLLMSLKVIKDQKPVLYKK